MTGGNWWIWSVGQGEALKHMGIEVLFKRKKIIFFLRKNSSSKDLEVQVLCLHLWCSS